MSDGDLFKAIKKTVGSKISNLILPKQKEEEKQQNNQNNDSNNNFDSGLYFRLNKTEFVGLNPYMDFFEPQKINNSLFKTFKELSLSKAENLFYRGCRRLVEGQKESAFKHFKNALEKDPQLADAYFMLGIFDKEEKQYKSSVENFRKAMFLQGNLGKTIKPALPSFRLILPVTSNLSFAFYPDLIGASIMLSLSMRANASENAGDELEQILDLLPGNNTLIFILSIILYESGKTEKAIKILNGTKYDSPDSALNLVMLSKILLDNGHAEDVIQMSEKYFQSDSIEADLKKDLDSILKNCLDKEKGKSSSDELLLFKRLQINAPISTKTKIKSKISEENEEEVKIIQFLHYLAENKKYRLYDGITIGKKECDIDFAWDNEIEERHAVIKTKNGKWYIEPLSENAIIYVNDFQISKKASINLGDIIKIGSSEFEFKQTKKRPK
ncbi:FHA domain-containing protein [bacterium]|nr:FHA domain-containing protein [bacterium]